jgi:hypothetical protein
VDEAIFFTKYYCTTERANAHYFFLAKAKDEDYFSFRTVASPPSERGGYEWYNGCVSPFSQKGR